MHKGFGEVSAYPRLRRTGVLKRGVDTVLLQKCHGVVPNTPDLLYWQVLKFANNTHSRLVRTNLIKGDRIVVSCRESPHETCCYHENWMRDRSSHDVSWLLCRLLLVVHACGQLHGVPRALSYQ